MISVALKSGKVSPSLRCSFDAASGGTAAEFCCSAVGAAVVPVLPVPPTLHPTSATAISRPATYVRDFVTNFFIS